MSEGRTRIGDPAGRIEDRRLLSGKGRYIDDIHLDDMLHASIVRSSVPHGLIRSVDTEAARTMPGVVAIYTVADIAEVHGGRVPKIPMRLAPLAELARFEQDVMAGDRVRYVGEPVAMVIAATAAQAEDAANAVWPDIEALPAVADWRSAATAESLLFPAEGTNAAITYTAHKGDATGVTGAYSRKERFSTQRQAGMTMETRGLIAEWDETRSTITVHGAAKVPFFIRRILATAMELPLESVNMIEVDVGGGFGVRGEFYPEDFLVPFAARKLGRRIKWIEDRLEHLLGTNHSREMECELEIVCDATGRILALRGTASVDVGAYMRSSVSAPPRNVAQFISGPYDVPHVLVESTCYLTNKTPIGTYRGPGLAEADFFRERLFDIAARDLNIDPIDFRRINLVAADKMPFQLPDVDGPVRKETLDGGDYTVTLDRCLQEIGWQDKAELQGQLIEGVYHGLALSCFIEGTAAGPKETARIEIERDGQLSVYVGSSNVGQGVATVMAQIAADTLGLNLGDIRVQLGSTTLLSEGFGSFHSRATVMGGSAVLLASRELKRQIVKVVSEHCHCAEAEVAIGPKLAVSTAAMTFDRIGLGQLGIQATAEFASDRRTYGFGAAAAHVTVDPRAGVVAVVDYFAVQDIGRIINAATAHGQVIGAIVQGLGGALLEQLVYDKEGQLLTGTLADYLMPTAVDFPNVRAVLLEGAPSSSNPLGAKGVGEGGTIPVGGVIANAVAAALASLKVEPNSLPISPMYVWELIRIASQKAVYQAS